MRFPSGLRVGGDLGCPMGFEIPEWAVGKVRVNHETGCWEWMPPLSSQCRGYCYVGKVWTFSHRRSYSELVGPIPDGLFVCHHCDVPNCINPEHLFVGSQKDNMADAARKGRIASGENHGLVKHPEVIVRGEQHHAVRHSDAVVFSAVQMYAELGSCTLVARRMGVSANSVRSWVTGRSRRSATGI
jgi:hypothetical protein